MNIPKAELHVHLEGTITPILLHTLAQRNHIPLSPERFPAEQTQYFFHDFLDFLHNYDIVAAVIKCPQDYYDLTFDYLRRCATYHTLYTEMMYSPEHAEKSSGIPSIEHLNAIQQAIDDAYQQWGIVGRILMTGVRHFGEEAVFKVAQQAISVQLPCVVGFALGGDEVHYPPELFIKAYQLVAAHGMSSTVHAGEFADANSMLVAIQQLSVQRIGHGIQAIHSPKTMDALLQHNITLEIATSSNIALGRVSDIQHHPLPAFLQHGIRVCLNSDDPPFFNSELSEEYARVQQAYHYSDDVMLQFTRMALEAAFVDQDTKKILLEKCKIIE
ncbi:MAG: adenosine deaminase [Legionellaceae bacterium]|nr:adenosine deaminase [Legionellaceae bacterium]